MADRHKRRIRNYLLDSKLQLRYTLIMVLISSALTGVLGYIWYRQMRETSKTVEVKALISLTEHEIQQLQDEMKSQDRLRLGVLVGFGVIFALVVAAYGIILTHKVAGPLFKITRYMTEIKDGRIGPIYDLRRGDQLRDFYAVFKEMHISLRQDVEQDLSTLNEVIQSAESHMAKIGEEGGAGDLERSLAALREMRDRKEARLDKPQDG